MANFRTAPVKSDSDNEGNITDVKILNDTLIERTNDTGLIDT